MSEFRMGPSRATALGRATSVVVVAVALSLGVMPGVSRAAPTPVTFLDSFTTDQGWQTHEETKGSACYGTGIGQVTRPTGVAVIPPRSLRVGANEAGSNRSNHLIAGKKISSYPSTGPATYLAWARQEPAATDRIGETGPEISVQSTRRNASGQHITTVAGIQFLANPQDTAKYGSWQVWTDNSGTPAWQKFMQQPIKRGVWYQLTLEADFTSGMYKRFILAGDGLVRAVDLSGHRMGFGNKGFSTEATEITLEAENSWTNCGTTPPTKFAVNYDEVLFVGQR